MYVKLPRPIIKCGKCSSTNIVIPERVIPEWPANAPPPTADGMRTGDVELRCKDCGHEKVHVHRDWETLSIGSTLTIKTPTEETF